MEPRNYVGDNFARVTPIYKVTQYNIACCYSMLGQVCCHYGSVQDHPPDRAGLHTAQLHRTVSWQPSWELVTTAPPNALLSIYMLSRVQAYSRHLQNLCSRGICHGALMSSLSCLLSPFSQVDEGLKSLEAAMAAGFDSYDQVGGWVRMYAGRQGLARARLGRLPAHMLCRKNVEDRQISSFRLCISHSIDCHIDTS